MSVAPPRTGVSCGPSCSRRPRGHCGDRGGRARRPCEADPCGVRNGLFGFARRLAGERHGGGIAWATGLMHARASGGASGRGGHDGYSGRPGPRGLGNTDGQVAHDGPEGHGGNGGQAANGGQGSNGGQQNRADNGLQVFLSVLCNL